ncbi:MAG: helix-turn-helix transcriptional regulator [Bacteroidales bacterium]|nr:helix-turn-helix transcriptional regulator [Bacteroidales bacterium]
MKDRIAHIMRAKNLKASDFAELLGIQPSGISHILSGRNQPSLDFVKKIKENFPEYNLDWIIFGKGPMTTSEPYKKDVTPPVKDTTPPVVKTDPIAPEIPFGPAVEPSTQRVVESSAQNVVETPTQSVVKPDLPSKQPKSTVKSTVKSMVILYDDGTFEHFSPR